MEKQTEEGEMLVFDDDTSNSEGEGMNNLDHPNKRYNFERNGNQMIMLMTHSLIMFPTNDVRHGDSKVLLDDVNNVDLIASSKSTFSKSRKDFTSSNVTGRGSAASCTTTGEQSSGKSVRSYTCFLRDLFA